MHALHERVQYLEGMLADQHNADHGKETYILDSGAQPTHTAKPHADMQKSNGTLTQTANGQRARITHTGTIRLKQKNKTMHIAAVHAPQIRENLLSVHDLTEYGHVTFTPTHAYLHKPTKIPTAIFTARITKANKS